MNIEIYNNSLGYWLILIYWLLLFVIFIILFFLLAILLLARMFGDFAVWFGIFILIVVFYVRRTNERKTRMVELFSNTIEILNNVKRTKKNGENEQEWKMNELFWHLTIWKPFKTKIQNLGTKTRRNHNGTYFIGYVESINVTMVEKSSRKNINTISSKFGKRIKHFETFICGKLCLFVCLKHRKMKQSREIERKKII